MIPKVFTAKGYDADDVMEKIKKAIIAEEAAELKRTGNAHLKLVSSSHSVIMPDNQGHWFATALLCYI